MDVLKDKPVVFPADAHQVQVHDGQMCWVSWECLVLKAQREPYH